ncbi:DUF4291 domain-containing protein [Undibacterium sp. TJN19]|uniref:DUF4291 domain-containing protein n=1 Tax=Undibacterium sp. TJN19 TaxID=3413055 RepID=UPI003BF2B58D
MKFQTYQEQLKVWPDEGKHVMAQFDDDTIIVYQAYSNAIAEFAIKNQYFGGEFKYSRMSWIKPNFLWMMYRSGWAQKAGQECILAIRIKRVFFDEILEAAVSSTYDQAKYASHAAWQGAVANSDVRLQWDPDHDPSGQCLQRRAVQLGLRGQMLHRFGNDEIVEIMDLSSFVKEQRLYLETDTALITPAESVYRSI